MASHEHDRPKGWLGVEVRHLVALEAIDRCGSFSAAADELGYVQSAVSQQIAQLERSVGTQLIERQRGLRAAGLTDAGRKLATHARQLVREFQAARLDLAVLEAGEPHALSGGMAPGIAEWLMPSLMAEARRYRAPQVRFVETASTGELAQLVDAGELDVGFTYSAMDPSVFEMRRIADDRLVVVTSAASSLARFRGSVEPEQLTSFPLMAPATAEGLAAVEPELFKRGLDLSAARRSCSQSELLAFATSGDGFSLMPSMAVDHCRDVHVVGFAGAQPRLSLYVIWQHHRRHAGVLEAFADMAIGSVQAVAAEDLAFAA